MLDVRWALGDPHGRDHYTAGHIPGAVYVDLDTELAAPPSPGGRPPSAAGPRRTCRRSARRWGIGPGRPVVVYDDLGNTAAARAWWLLRYAGVTDVTLLDGALGAWRSAGLPLESGVPADPLAGRCRPARGRPARHRRRRGRRTRGRQACCWTPVPPSATGVRWNRSTRARATSRARSPPRPGRTWRPTARSCQPRSCASGFRARGADDAARIGVYCGSGVTAAHQIAALALAGFDATLFPGSWSAWSADPARPAATGPLPS